MILKILKEVADQRLQNETFEKLDTDIRLSFPFMLQAIAELREKANYTFIRTEMSDEFTMMVGSCKFTVHHRSYKDDSNDDDVEKMVLNYLINNYDRH